MSWKAISFRYLIPLTIGAFLTLCTAQIIKLAPPREGIYHCAFPDFDEDEIETGSVYDFVKLTGKNIVWAYFSNNWLNQKIYFPTQFVKNIHAAGVIPYIRVCPRSDWNNPQKDLSNPGYYALQKIIDGVFDKELHQWARDAAAVGFPLCVEFGPEINADWFYWDGVHNGGVKFNGPARCAAAYRHFVDICRAEGAYNITWFLHLDAEGADGDGVGGPWNAMKFFYPGDSYIDWLGISCYGATLPGDVVKRLDQVLKPSIYNELAAISPTKPIALLEFACVQTRPVNAQPGWVKDAFTELTAQKLWPRVKAISWWHSNFIENKDTIKMRLDASFETLTNYRTAIADSVFKAMPIFDSTTAILYHHSFSIPRNNFLSTTLMAYDNSIKIPTQFIGKLTRIEVFTLNGAQLGVIKIGTQRKITLPSKLTIASGIYPVLCYFK